MDAPKLDLDWEVGIFRALRGLWRRIAPAAEPEWDSERVAHLSDHEGALRVLAQVIAGYPVRILPARGVGGVRGRDLLLPTHLDIAPDPEANRGLYVLRAAISAALFHVLREEGEGGRASSPILELGVIHRAIAHLEETMPGFAEPHREACALALHGRPALDTFTGQARLLELARRDALAGAKPWEDADLFRAYDAAPEGKGESPDIAIWGRIIPHEGSWEEEAVEGEGEGEQETLSKPTSEVEARPVEEIRRLTLDEKAQEEAVLQHTFEKVETADSYKGGARDADASDDLDEHLEALEEVDLSEVIRGGDPARSLLKADIQLDAEVPDVNDILPFETGIAYDEWDHRAGKYKPGWCTVYPTKMGRGDASWAKEALPRQRKLIELLRRRLQAHRSERRPLGRQLDGEDIDVGALVDELGAQQAGQGGSQRLYQRRARIRRSFATTVLLDVSLSSDSWVDNRRVLDVSREAALVLGEVTSALGDQLQILAFASHTRNRCRVWEVLGWNEPWVLGRARLGSLKPQGYTRIGPALRHGQEALMASGAARQLLLLISDGKPTDFDRYEGRYGVADVRQALREAQRAGIAAHALAVDASARDYLPAMFGTGAWHILPHPGALPEALSTVYGRLTGG